MTVKEYIKSRGVTQTHAAMAIGMNANVLEAFLRGHRPLPRKHLSKVALYLGVSEKEVLENKITKGVPHEFDA